MSKIFEFTILHTFVSDESRSQPRGYSRDSSGHSKVDVSSYNIKMKDVGICIKECYHNHMQ